MQIGVQPHVKIGVTRQYGVSPTHAFCAWLDPEVAEPHPDVITRVAVAISPLAKGCALSLTHENVPRAHASYVEGRWTGILYGLGLTLIRYPQHSTTIRSKP